MGWLVPHVSEGHYQEQISFENSWCHTISGSEEPSTVYFEICLPLDDRVCKERCASRVY